LQLRFWLLELKIPGRLFKHPGQFQGGLLTHSCYEPDNSGLSWFWLLRIDDIEVIMLATMNRDREIVGLPPFDANYQVAQ
jgi:hypothetical protein